MSDEIWTKFPKHNLNIVFDNGGVGDHIGSLKACLFIKEQFPYMTPYVWVPNYMLDLARNLAPDLIIRSFDKAKTKYNETWPSRRLTSSKTYTNLRTHIVDHAFRALANQDAPSPEWKNYLKLNTERINIDKFSLPEKYVVITTGFTAEVREMLPQYINEIIEYVLKKGYTPVFLGKHQAPRGFDDELLKGTFKAEEIHYEKGINLIDKTTLLQAGKIIAGAAVLIGLDNGLAHVAGTTDTPIVVGYTTVAPEHRMPYRENKLGHNVYPVVPPDDQPEKFFQSRWDFLFAHDYKTSFLGNVDLIKSLTSDLYIEQLEKILK